MAGTQGDALRHARNCHCGQHLRRSLAKAGRGRETPTQMRTHVLSTAASRIAFERDAAARSFVEKARVLRFESIVKLDGQGRDLIKERAQLTGSINAAKSAWVLAIVDQKMLLAIERSKLRVAVIDQELSAISAARDAAASNGASIAAKADLAAQQREVERLVAQCSRPLAPSRCGWHPARSCSSDRISSRPAATPVPRERNGGSTGRNRLPASLPASPFSLASAVTAR